MSYAHYTKNMILNDPEEKFNLRLKFYMIVINIIKIYQKHMWALIV